MNRKPVAAPDGQNVTFVELFFDLVFVFSVTQVVTILHGHVTWTTAGQALLVFWLIWWAWSQFTWSLNAANTTHHLVALSVLSATGVAFFMAVAVPDAFQDRAPWFAIAYMLVRSIGLAVMAWANSDEDANTARARVFTIIAVGGLIAVVAGGALGGTAQYWLWGLSIFLDVVAGIVAGNQEGWSLRPEHFVERHGLFVIIALGETLIVAAVQVTDGAWSTESLAVAGLAVALTCGFWWSYFTQAKLMLDHAMESRRGIDQANLARDAFSFIHFPMMCGVISYAVAIEEALAHPDEPLPRVGRIALAVGLALFTAGMGVAVWRATRRILVGRFIAVAISAALIVVVSDVHPLVTMAIAVVGIGSVGLIEHRTLAEHEVAAEATA